jgi:alkanesulfonate monooxygenase SsuD/methylene tetrahydromethanopterin reductase-like flavin-dependent oxidoreductase (luciferase family)
MDHGFILPGGTARRQLAQAEKAEAAGWDAVFVYESAAGVDAWSLLSAMAVRTERIRLGTMLTPLPWRRPWKLASQAVTLDQLSGGRAILAVGLGAMEPEIGLTSEERDRKVRAARMDEALDLITGLWSGETVFAGEHFQMDLSGRGDLEETGRCVQRPRLPVWIVGAWNRPKSMARVLKGDGILPNPMTDDGEHRGLEHQDVADIRAWLDEQGAPGDFDLVTEGETPSDDAAAAAEQVRPWAEAGATWWLEARWSDPSEVDARIAAGPPRPQPGSGT